MMDEPARPKIFVIGLNKCGTSSFHTLFRASGLRSVHYNLPGSKLRLAERMISNYSCYLPILDSIDGFDAYSDMMATGARHHIDTQRFYPQLFDEYPDARFILNTRSKDAWLNSRKSHEGAGFRFFTGFQSIYDRDPDGTLALWSHQWDAHHSAVRAYFADRADAHFLEFDIEKDDPERIAEFVRPHIVDIAHWGQANRTEDPAIRAARRARRAARRAARQAGRDEGGGNGAP